MKNFKITSIAKANATLDAVSDLLNPALATAGVTTIEVDGKPVAANEAPLENRLKALFAVSPPGAQSAQVADVIVSNDQLASQLDAVTAERDSLNASNQSLTSKVALLTSERDTQAASVATLTAEKANLLNQVNASTKEIGRITNEANALNEEISKLCLAVGCIDFAAEDNKDQHTRLAAANKMAAADKLKAYAGAVNSSLVKVGINIGTLPAPGGKPATALVSENTVLLALNAATDPMEKSRLRKQHSAAIRAGFKPAADTRSNN